MTLKRAATNSCQRPSAHADGDSFSKLGEQQGAPCPLFLVDILSRVGRWVDKRTLSDATQQHK